MSAGDFFILGPDGFPETHVDVDELKKRGRRISSLLAANSRDSAVVLAIIARELQDQAMPESVRTLLSLGVLFDLTTGVLGPFMTLAEATYPQHDYVSDLLALTNPDNQSLQGRFETPEGTPPSEGESHV